MARPVWVLSTMVPRSYSAKASMEAIAMVMDEHGILCEDGHWMTNDELIALPDEEVVCLIATS